MLIRSIEFVFIVEIKGHYIKECRFKNFNKKGGFFKSEYG